LSLDASGNQHVGMLDHSANDLGTIDWATLGQRGPMQQIDHLVRVQIQFAAIGDFVHRAAAGVRVANTHRIPTASSR
jgi:hypothetical protein